MVAIVPPSDDEIALLMILADDSGTDLAEFAWKSDQRKAPLNQGFYDERGWTNPSPPTQGTYRLYHFQWYWSICTDQYQIDLAGRAVGKTESIVRRACAYPFSFPGAQMALLAPYANQRNLMVQPVEKRLLGCKMTADMLKKEGGSNGISKSPSWRATFKNGATMESRIPGPNGDGANGLHFVRAECDEMQAYNPRGWAELPSCFEAHFPDAQMRFHGVTNGETNGFSERARSREYTVHKPMAMHHPKWGDAEREKAIRELGGRTTGDYMRNIYGEHNDGEAVLFILSKLMQCIDGDENSFYNREVYKHIKIDGSTLVDENGLIAEPILTTDLEDQIPVYYFEGWTGDSREEGKQQDWSAPNGYYAFCGGMDVGTVRDPSEIIITGERVTKKGEPFSDVLLRLTLNKVPLEQQRTVIRTLFRIFGQRLVSFGIDRTGEGIDMWQHFMSSDLADRIWGYNFSEKVPTGWLPQENVPDWHLRSERDRQIWRTPPEFGLSHLRTKVVHPGAILLPNDTSMRKEFEGTAPKKSGGGVNVSGLKKAGLGGFHVLDAYLMWACAKILPDILEATRPEVIEHVPDDFVGAW